MALSEKLIKPGQFLPDRASDTDSRRCEFDIMNDTVIASDTQVNAVMIGDSITHFFDNNVHYHKYGCILNRGIGGDTVNGVNFRFEADVVQLKPKVCIILVGVNNTWELENHKDEDGLFDPQLLTETIDEMIAQYEEIYAKAKSAGIEIWLCSATPMGEGMPSLKARNPMFVRINEEYKKLVEKHGGKYVDYHSVLVDEDGITFKNEYSRDGVHPNGEGYKIMASVLAPMLEEAFCK